MIYNMMAGATVLASILIALFFLCFRRSPDDRFLLFVALAFLIEDVRRLISTISLETHEDSPCIT